MSYVRGKYAKAACLMLDWLRDNKVKGGPVAQPSKRDPTIYVYGMTPSGLKKLPDTFAGFKVEGTTASPDYEHIPMHDLVPLPNPRTAVAVDPHRRDQVHGPIHER